MNMCIRVEPQHVNGVVVPDGENEDHSRLEGSAHLSKTTLLLEGSLVSERLRMQIGE